MYLLNIKLLKVIIFELFCYKRCLCLYSILSKADKLRPWLLLDKPVDTILSPQRDKRTPTSKNTNVEIQVELDCYVNSLILRGFFLSMGAGRSIAVCRLVGIVLL